MWCECAVCGYMWCECACLGICGVSVQCVGICGVSVQCVGICGVSVQCVGIREIPGAGRWTASAHARDTRQVRNPGVQLREETYFSKRSLRARLSWGMPGLSRFFWLLRSNTSKDFTRPCRGPAGMGCISYNYTELSHFLKL